MEQDAVGPGRGKKSKMQRIPTDGDMERGINQANDEPGDDMERGINQGNEDTMAPSHDTDISFFNVTAPLELGE